MYTPSSTDSVATPTSLLNFLKDTYGEFYDPCKFNPNFDRATDIDGLSVNWGNLCKDFVFVNPPYSRTMKWVLKSNEHPDITIVYLLKNSTLGSAYYNNLRGPSNMIFLNPHIKFPGYNKKARFSSFLLIRGPTCANVFKFLKL